MVHFSKTAGAISDESQKNAHKMQAKIDSMPDNFNADLLKKLINKLLCNFYKKLKQLKQWKNKDREMQTESEVVGRS